MAFFITIWNNPPFIGLVILLVLLLPFLLGLKISLLNFIDFKKIFFPFLHKHFGPWLTAIHYVFFFRNPLGFLYVLGPLGLAFLWSSGLKLRMFLDGFWEISWHTAIVSLTSLACLLFLWVRSLFQLSLVYHSWLKEDEERKLLREDWAFLLMKDQNPGNWSFLRWDRSHHEHYHLHIGQTDPRWIQWRRFNGVMAVGGLVVAVSVGYFNIREMQKYREELARCTAETARATDYAMVQNKHMTQGAFDKKHPLPVKHLSSGGDEN